MSLEEKLSVIREGAKERIPAEALKQMHRATDELRDSGIMDKALNVGDKMPSFELPNTKGEMVGSDELLEKGNLVVTFYRGVW